MESRKITIVSSSSQSRKEIMSAATTLAELKNDLRAAQINYDGMTFMEGYTKTELKSDDSVLPTNVPTKNGKTTNELVFMLTAPQKKIRSGAMDRRSCYAFFQSNADAAAAFKAKFGKNYTNGTTADLAAFAEGYGKKAAPKAAAKPAPKAAPAPKKAEKKECSCEASSIVENAKTFVESLYENNGISEANYNTLVAILDGGEVTEPESSLSDEDINEMFDFAK